MDGDGIEKEYGFSVYINPNRKNPKSQKKNDMRTLEDIITSLRPIGPWRVTETWCGFLAAFSVESDALNLMDKSLAGIFNSPLLAKFTNDLCSKHVITLRDVPLAVPESEIEAILEKQGIFPTSIVRFRQNMKIEIKDLSQYDSLLRNGLDFFGATRFKAVPERLSRTLPDPVIQCYKCQNFWHIAKYCNLPVRCVRCGEPHSVESCLRPRSEATCCQCGGRHHAAYRYCPVRTQLINPMSYHYAPPAFSEII